MNKTMVAIIISMMSALVFGYTQSYYDAEERRLLEEQEKLELELQQIKDDQRKELWSPGYDVTEAAIEAERQRRKEAKFMLESFGGFKFGSWAFGSTKLDADFSREVELTVPIRVLDRARLYYTPQHRELWKVVLFGYVDGATSKEDCYLELAKIMDILNEKYRVDLTQYLYVGEKRFASEFHKEIGRMDFDGSVYPSCEKGKDGRNRIRFTLAASNFTPFDKEEKKELNISADEGADKL